MQPGNRVVEKFQCTTVAVRGIRAMSLFISTFRYISQKVNAVKKVPPVESIFLTQHNWLVALSGNTANAG